MTDFRVGYLREAGECLRSSNRILAKYPDDWHKIPAFWANIFGAIANGSMASVSDTAAMGFIQSEQERRDEQREIRELLDRKLGSR